MTDSDKTACWAGYGQEGRLFDTVSGQLWETFRSPDGALSAQPTDYYLPKIAEALRRIVDQQQGRTAPAAAQGEALTDEAPPNGLPTWDECQLRVENSDHIAKRVAEGGYGADRDVKLATELHRFIYEYDDADPYRSAWFLHRLEKLLDETKRAALAQGEAPPPSVPVIAGSTVVSAPGACLKVTQLHLTEAGKQALTCAAPHPEQAQPTYHLNTTERRALDRALRDSVTILPEQAQPAVPALTDAQIDALDTFALHALAPRGRQSVRDFARAVLAAATPLAQVEQPAVTLEALKAARQFIRNGVDLGFIRMPDADTPDSAHETLPLIDRALAALTRKDSHD